MSDLAAVKEKLRQALAVIESTDGACEDWPDHYDEDGTPCCTGCTIACLIEDVLLDLDDLSAAPLSADTTREATP